MDSSASCSRSRQSISGERTNSSNLRDLLQIKEDDNRRPSVTLRAILTNDASPSQAQPNRTLLDIIINDSISGNTDIRNTWKLLRDKISLRRPSSSVQIPATDDSTENSNRMISEQRSLRSGDVPFPEDSFPQSPSRDELNSSSRSMSLRRNQSRTPERQLSPSMNRQDSGTRARLDWEEVTVDTEETADGEGTGEGGDPPARMSLMSLLAENDGSAYTVDVEEEEDEVESRGGGGIEYSNCCVCMVRHKGSAFIPCGHTFCRLCSRELWVQRGSCPLCNNHILEILDIF